MSLYKRKKTWWTDFSVNGQRFRESLDTTDWREAQRLEKEKISEAQQGKLAPSSQQFARLAFSEAADRYLESRKLELSARSLKKRETAPRSTAPILGHHSAEPNKRGKFACLQRVPWAYWSKAILFEHGVRCDQTNSEEG